MFKDCTGKMETNKPRVRGGWIVALSSKRNLSNKEHNVLRGTRRTAFEKSPLIIVTSLPEDLK